MEKRKDIDMLRFYGGDIHQKNKEGEYVITNNLVNPKNKEDMLWGDRDAYRTLNALPQNYEEGHHIDAARFVMITAAFEWEFRRIFPEGIKKKEKKIKAEETVVQLLTPLIENNTGEIKSILKYLKKCVGNDPLSSKLTFVGMELGNIIDIFGKHLYALNGKKLKYSEMGERLAAQRNNFAHGNLDKDFDELALLDLIYLELILYAMQLKFYGVEDVKIKKAINDLFHKNIRIDE